ncbi:guanine nucleotide binding protein, alpha subunit [Mycena latifolia]|nr:guanine nucleotide binding protein, alpha subunit [Mycena latifolia]
MLIICRKNAADIPGPPPQDGGRTEDGFAAALLPPPNETLDERKSRRKAAIDAKKVSDDIDEMLRRERNHRKKPRTEIHVFLLGQSESGKSTCLKQFQLLHTPAAFHAERIAWRAVIYLNLVRSVKWILDALQPETDNVDKRDDGDSLETASVIISSNGRPPSAISGTQVPNYEGYRRRLQPLMQLEDRLNSSTSSPTSSTGSTSKGSEVTMHTSTNWKKAFPLGNRSKSPKSAHSGEIEGWWEDPDDPVHTLHACAPYMQDMWRDPDVRQRLREKQLRLEESSGFYLDEIPRITAKKYIPTDADVLKARMKTMGVVEHTFSISSSSNRGAQWKIYDVGGSRNQRAAWRPYFDDIDAIIFLAPISAFDQVLAEDPHVNRLEDSVLLWKAVVSNKLLAQVNIVLFLNKCDLLQAKLEAGVQLSHYVISYGRRPNDYHSASRYFRKQFHALYREGTPNEEREFYIHLTAVTDQQRTTPIISNVQDIINKGNLKTMKLV